MVSFLTTFYYYFELYYYAINGKASSHLTVFLLNIVLFLLSNVMNEYSLAQTFLLLTILPATLCSILGLLYFKKLSPQIQYVVYLSLYFFIGNIVAMVLWINAKNNLFLGHIHTVIEFLLLSRVYQIEFRHFLPSRFFLILVIIFLSFCLLNTYFWQPYTANNSYAKTLESIILIGLAMTYFYKTLREAKIEKLEKEPLFWINCAILMYFSVDIFIFIFSNYMLQIAGSLATQIWVIHGIFLILFYSICFFAIWLSKSQR